MVRELCAGVTNINTDSLDFLVHSTREATYKTCSCTSRNPSVYLLRFENKCGITYRN